MRQNYSTSFSADPGGAHKKSARTFGPPPGINVRRMFRIEMPGGILCRTKKICDAPGSQKGLWGKANGVWGGKSIEFLMTCDQIVTVIIF
jgi:hypothetical protein